jgi:hypothetical protein
MCGHGFRATARTILREQLKIEPEYIELELGHQVIDPNGRAYNRTSLLPERRLLMQERANYLDKLKSGKQIPTPKPVPLTPYSLLLRTIQLDKPHKSTQQGGPRWSRRISMGISAYVVHHINAMLRYRLCCLDSLSGPMREVKGDVVTT